MYLKNENSQIVRLNSLVENVGLAHHQVEGMSLSHLAVDYGPGQATRTVLPLSPSSI